MIKMLKIRSKLCDFDNPNNEELIIQASRVFNVSSKPDPDDFNFNKSALKPINFA